MSKVMLADHTLDGGDSECLAKLTFPKLVLPKYDGIRVHTNGGRLYSRTGKLIPNVWLQKQLSGLISGLEGEVVVNGNFADTTSCLRSYDKTDFDFRYYLFDSSLSVGDYNDRYMFLVDS